MREERKEGWGNREGRGGRELMEGVGGREIEKGRKEVVGGELRKGCMEGVIDYCHNYIHGCVVDPLWK